MKYPIAKNGIFRTVQGEGGLLGVPMVFVRLAGCSIGCPQCDTNYRVERRLTTEEICREVKALLGTCEWVWITGGEPFDYNLTELIDGLESCAMVALATSGLKPVNIDLARINFLSVSPHKSPKSLKISRGTQINLVPGLNGLCLSEWNGFDVSCFKYAWITPLAKDDGLSGINEAIEFIGTNPDWRLGVQAHKQWGLP